MAVCQLFGLRSPIIGGVVVIACRNDTCVSFASGGHYTRKDDAVVVDYLSVGAGTRGRVYLYRNSAGIVVARIVIGQSAVLRITVLQGFGCQTHCGGILVHFVDDISSDAEVDTEIEEYILVGERVE